MTIKTSRIRDIAIALTVFVMAAVLGPGPQAALAASRPAPGASPVLAAGKGTSQQKAWVTWEVRGLLKHNPGAKQISPNAVRYRGAIMGVTPLGSASAATPDSASGVCPANYVCLFTNADFAVGIVGESWIDFKTCGEFFNLFDYHWVTDPEGDTSSYANVTSSIDYPGTAIQHFATFSHNGDTWLKLQRDHYLRNLTQNAGPNPHGNSNDWITGLYAC